MGKAILRLACSAVLLCIAAWPALSQESPEQFFRGKRVRILIGSSVGGGYDTYARLIARYLGQYIPGNPTIVPENMPGAGGNVAAQYIYAVAPKDGLHIGAVYANSLTEPLLGDKSRMRHDPSKFNYIGNANREVFICVVRSDSPVTGFSDMFARELIIGSTSVGGPSRDYPTMANNLLGTKFRLVSGYPGAREILLAMERGEVQGACGLSWAVFAAHYSHWLSRGSVRILVQEDAEGDLELNKLGVPLVVTFAKTAQDREVLRLVYSQGYFGRPYVVAPSVDQERVDALRNAFMETVRSDQLLADAKRMNLMFMPNSGGDLQRIIAEMYAAPAEVIDRAKQALAHPQ